MATKFLSGVDLNSQRAINVADPSSASDAATKSYVDNLLAGIRWKTAVRAATTTNGTLATAFENGDVLDGVTLVTGYRILLKDQTDAKENGIYTVNASGAPTRATDADSTAELDSAAVLVTDGTANSDKAFVQTSPAPVIATDNIAWTPFVGGGSSYTADGQGIELSSTTFNLELDGSTLSKSASGLRLATGIAGAGIVYNSNALDVNVGAGLEISSDAVRISTAAAGNGLAGGGGSALALASTVAGAGLTHTTGVIDVVAAGGGGITVNANDIQVDTSIVVTTPSTVVRKYATAIGNASLTTFTVTHNLNAREVTVGIYETSTPYTEVYADVVHSTVNTVTVTFPSAPSSSQYTVVVHG